MGAVPAVGETAAASEAGHLGHAHLAQGSNRSIPLDPDMAKRLEDARREAAQHEGHERRAPRPERLQR